MTPLDKVPREWLGHEFTFRLRKHWEEQKELALRALFTVARASSDPKVTRRLEAYEQIGSCLAQLGKEHADGSDDGDD